MARISSSLLTSQALTGRLRLLGRAMSPYAMDVLVVLLLAALLALLQGTSVVLRQQYSRAVVQSTLLMLTAAPLSVCAERVCVLCCSIYAECMLVASKQPGQPIWQGPTIHTCVPCTSAGASAQIAPWTPKPGPVDMKPVDDYTIRILNGREACGTDGSENGDSGSRFGTAAPMC